MANSLNENLDGRYVVLREEDMHEDYRDIKHRVFKVTGGFGASAGTLGSALFGESPHDGEKWRTNSFSVERFATDEEIRLAGGKP
jgi:hypothetical protein